MNRSTSKHIAQFVLFIYPGFGFAFSGFISHSSSQTEDQPMPTPSRRTETSDQPLVSIINYPYQIWADAATKIHLTLFKPDFSPAAGAEVTVNGEAAGTADANGVCIFDHVPGNRGDHLVVARLTENGVNYSTQKTFSCNARTVSFRADKLYVYTDRGVYNPGQDILTRIIAWQLRREYAPVADAKIQLLLQNRDGKVFSGAYVTTDAFGIAATKLALPDNMPEGDYELVVLYEKARETAELRVLRFVPPVINIRHNLKRYLTNAQQSLDADIHLNYFSGGDMKSSKLVLSILTADKKTIFEKKYNSLLPEYHFSLDKNDLKAIRNQLSLESPIKISITVTDSYGQTDAITWDLTYTARPYTAVLELDKDAYLEGETVQLLAKVVDLDRQPAAGIPLVLTVPEHGIKKSAKTDPQGVATFTFKMPGNAVVAVLTSPIMAPELSRRSVPFQEQKPMMSKVSEPPKGMGTLTKITVNFDPNYIPVEQVIHVDFTDISGALVLATTIPISIINDRYVAEGEIIGPTWGTMLTNLYCCAVEKIHADSTRSVTTVGFITEGQHITFYPGKELDIVVENFKPVTAPGEKVEFKVRVTGGKGEKALGIALVDAAVLSLLDPFIKSPVRLFYNPQAKTIASGGAGVLTWPVVDRNWGNPWRDIAYSNWGWKAPGVFVHEQAVTQAKGYGDSLGVSTEAMMLNDEQETYAATLEPPPPVPPGEIKPQAYAPAAKVLSPVDMESSEPDDGISATKRKDDTAATQQKPGAQIMIRTRFPETTLWQPSLITKDGASTITATMPEEITNQELSILATDKDGYIGLERQQIQVTQPLFARAAFPAAMVLGDKISARALVRNLTDQNLTCIAMLQSDELDIATEKSQKIMIPANAAGVVEWAIGATSCGRKQFTLMARSGDLSDGEQKSIFVAPAGAPTSHVERGNARHQEDFTATIVTDPAATYRVVNLNIALPNVFPAIQAWQVYDTRPWYSPWAIAASMLMNAAMMEYGLRTGMAEDQLQSLRQQLNRAVAHLVTLQGPDGAWHWTFLADATAPDARPYLNGKNLYFTIAALRALAQVKKLDIAVAETVMINAVDYIFKQRNPDGLWSAPGAYFWEVVNQATNHALSAEIFEVLTFARLMLPNFNQYNHDLEALKDKMVPLLKKQPGEPMTVAAIIQGLSYWNEFQDNRSIQNLIKNSIDYLMSLKRKGHWEPHWYHAYGGMVELNARILELLASSDADKYESYLREGMTWLLSTREAWGAWHNDIGTATAIRALLKHGTFDEEKECTVTVHVNGNQVAQLDIDPADPYLSAAKLRYLEITNWIKNGENKIAVDYNGNLTASVMLELKEWGIGAPAAQYAMALKRMAPEYARLNEPVTVQLSLNARSVLPILYIEESIPSNAEVDIKSLQELKKSNKILDYSLDTGKLHLTLVNVKGQVQLAYRLKSIRSGTAVHAGTRVVDATDGQVLGQVAVSSLVVQ